MSLLELSDCQQLNSNAINQRTGAQKNILKKKMSSFSLLHMEKILVLPVTSQRFLSTSYGTENKFDQVPLFKKRKKNTWEEGG